MSDKIYMQDLTLPITDETTGDIEEVTYSFVQTDDDLETAGDAADAKAVGDEISQLKADIDSYSEPINDFFGVQFELEQGGLNTTTGAEVENNDRTRTKFLSLIQNTIIQSSLRFYVLKYTNETTFDSTVASAVTTFTVSTAGLYRLMFSTGDTGAVKSALKITQPSSIRSLDEITIEIDSNRATAYTFHDYNATGNINIPDARVFANKIIPAGQYIESITFRQRSLATAVSHKIEIWGVSNGVLDLKKTIIYLNTVSEEKDVTIPVGESYTDDVMVAAVFGSTFTIFSMVSATGNDRDVRTTDKSSNQLNYSDLVGIGYRLCLKANVYKTSAYLSNFADTLAGTPYNIVRIGANEEIKDIQTALNMITDDSATNPYIFQIMPGTYPKFLMQSAGRLRYISMIGTCKHDCIIRDDTGQYANAPANVRTNGLIKNLTFIATHDNPPAYADREDAAHKSYALHMDFGTQDVLFEDCVFISYQAPAVGIGCYQDVKYHFKNCEMYSYAPAYDATDTDNRTNWSLLSNYGGLFAHSNTGNNVTNQRLILDNCRIYSQNGNKGMWLAIAGTFSGGEMLLSLMNNMAISYAEGSVKTSISPELTIQPESYGNNWD